MRAVLPLLALLTTAFAGCAGDASSPDEAEIPEEAFDDLELEATDTTGIIRGIVVDDAIRPLEGAIVTLTIPGAGKQTVETTEAGTFGFDDLEPGTYFMRAEKFRYTSAQQSVEVVAGVKEPPVAKVLLVPDGSIEPFFQAITYDGYIECTTSFLVLCGLPNLLTGQEITQDRFTWTTYFIPNSTWIQAEMVWQSSQSLSPNLYFEMEALDGPCEGDGFLNRTEGPSPVYAVFDPEEHPDNNIGEECGIYFSLFSGHNDPLPRQPVTGWGIGVTIQQDFTMYIHSLYSFVPAPGWRFTVDGDPVVPE
jgi:hypothetical protein